VQLRRVDRGFARQLAKLWAVTFQDAYEEVHSTENIRAYCEANYSVDAAENLLSDPSVHCAVAFGDRSALGFHLVKHHGCPLPLIGESSELKQLYVVARAYGSGVGQALFEDAVRSVQRAGGSWIWLSVSDLNYRARAFYRKLSFEPLGKGPIFEVGSDRPTSTIMARKI